MLGWTRILSTGTLWTEGNQEAYLRHVPGPIRRLGTAAYEDATIVLTEWLRRLRREQGLYLRTCAALNAHDMNRRSEPSVVIVTVHRDAAGPKKLRTGD